jgi:16S rRNA pseudouridine516 synthase
MWQFTRPVPCCSATQSRAAKARGAATISAGLIALEPGTTSFFCIRHASFFIHPMIRADQLLSRYGYCSRREAAAWLKAGRVTRDGLPVLKPEQRVEPAAVLVDGAPVEFPHGLLVAFHKPAGVACSHNPAEAPLIYDLLPPRWLNRQPPPQTVGRLDRETSGLILLTDDGALLHRLTSPRHDVMKTYEVSVDTDISSELQAIFAAGTLLLRGEDKPCLPADLEVLKPRTARLHIREGKYHQVRRMFASQGCTVTALHRTRVGRVELGNLAAGHWREVAADEV